MEPIGFAGGSSPERPYGAVNQRDSVTVRVVRADQWRELREIRLRALRDYPEAFTTTAAQAESEPDEYWAERAALAARGEVWTTFLAPTRKRTSQWGWFPVALTRTELE